MGQRTRIVTEIWGFRGWKVRDVKFEDEHGAAITPLGGYELHPQVRVVLCVERVWAPRCHACGAVCRAGAHEKLPTRRWADLPWAGRAVQIEARPIRVKCARCRSTCVEMLAWAEPRQQQSRRFQQHIALDAASMPVLHVAAKYGLTWGVVRRAEGAALARWAAGRTEPPLVRVGLDEKWLGRRHRRKEKFVTIVSNLDTGEPLWFGYGRGEATVKTWLDGLTPAQKKRIQLVAMDMHAPFLAAVRADEALAHVVTVHDSFHIMKRAGQAIDELRREAFFRASPELRAVGRGRRWLVLRAWVRCSEAQKEELRILFSYNRRLGRAYQVVEEMRAALHAPNRDAIEIALRRILRRTQERRTPALRSWHDSILAHWDEIVAIAEHRPPTGRIEALNNNWETLVRRARGYRDHDYLLLKLRFMVANPIRSGAGVSRFLALGLPTPVAHAA